MRVLLMVFILSTMGCASFKELGEVDWSQADWSGVQAMNNDYMQRRQPQHQSSNMNCQDSSACYQGEICQMYVDNNRDVVGRCVRQ